MAGAAMMFTACSGSEDNDIIEPTPAQSVNGKYTLTVNASKVVDAATRALSPDGNTINATWTKGDEVKVYSVTGEGPSESESGTPVGTLTAQRDGATTTLSGEFESTYTPTVGAKLRLKLYDDAAYTNQDGTLDYIATNCDKAVADIIVGTVDAVTKAVTSTSTALFENRQAIVKFSLKQPNGTVTANGGEGYAAGIGDGLSDKCGDITITNSVTRVTATKGNKNNDVYCIGRGGGGHCFSVTIGGTSYGLGVNSNTDDIRTYIYEP